MARNTPMVQRKKFSTMISTPSYQAMIANTLRDPNRQKRFVAAITSAVAATPALQSCNPSSILAGALLGEELNLSPSPSAGTILPGALQMQGQGRQGEPAQGFRTGKTCMRTKPSSSLDTRAMSRWH